MLKVPCDVAGEANQVGKVRCCLSPVKTLTVGRRAALWIVFMWIMIVSLLTNVITK